MEDSLQRNTCSQWLDERHVLSWMPTVDFFVAERCASQ